MSRTQSLIAISRSKNYESNAIGGHHVCVALARQGVSVTLQY